MSMTAGDLWSAFRVDFSQAKKDVEKGAAEAGEKGGRAMGQRLKAALSKQDLGKGLMAGLGIGAGLSAVNLVSKGIGMVADAFTDSVDAARQFDSQLRTINTVAGVSDAQLERIGDSIQALSRETGKTTDELTAGFYDLVSAGVPAEHAMQVLKDSAVLATGALGTTGEAVDLITSALNAYKMEATESTRLTDVFASAVRDGKVTAAELGSSIAQIAPLAAAAGVSIEEVAAGYAQLTKNGVPAAQAATQMRAAISALLTPNAQLAQIQKEVNLNFAELARSDGLAVALTRLREAAGSDEAFAKALGSVEALSFSLLTTGDNAEAFAGQLRSVEDAARAGGVAIGQYEERAKSAEVRDARRAAEIKTLMQDFGAVVEPIYDALIGGASLVVQTIRRLGDAFRDFERFLSPHLAAIEDTDRALIDLAQRYGISEDALLSFAAAQRAAAQEATDAAMLVRDLQQSLALGGFAGTDEEKNALVAGLVDQIKELARVSGSPLVDVMTTARLLLGQFGLTAETADTFVQILANDLGIATNEAGEFVPQIEAAEEILQRFLATGGKLPAAIARGIDGAMEGLATLEPTATEAVTGALRGAFSGGVKVITEEGRQKLGDAVEALANHLTDRMSRIQRPHSQSIIKALREDVKQAAKDLQWELDHPEAWDRLTGRVQRRIEKLMARAAQADKEGNAKQTEILQRGAENMINLWEGITGLSWDYGLDTTDNFRRGTLRELREVEKAGEKVLDTAITALDGEDARFAGIGADSIISYASGMQSYSAMFHLRRALNNIVGIIPDFLRVHSPAKMGPLSEDGGPERWATRMVENMARGITAGLPGYQAALAGLSGTASLGLTASMGITAPMGSMAGMALSGGGHSVVEHRHTITREGAAALRTEGFDEAAVGRAMMGYVVSARDTAHIRRARRG